MQLYAVDQVSISSVRAESLRPGEKFTVSASLGEELLRKLPHAVSKKPPAPKQAPVSVRSVFDRLSLDLATAEQDAEEKKRLILQAVVDAQSDADAKIVSINDSVVSAQADADAKISAARTAADEEIQKIDDYLAARRAAAASADKVEAAADAGEGGQKSEPAPANKSEPAPANKTVIPPKSK